MDRIDVDKDVWIAELEDRVERLRIAEAREKSLRAISERALSDERAKVARVEALATSLAGPWKGKAFPETTAWATWASERIRAALADPS